MFCGELGCILFMCFRKVFNFRGLLVKMGMNFFELVWDGKGGEKRLSEWVWYLGGFQGDFCCLKVIFFEVLFCSLEFFYRFGF